MPQGRRRSTRFSILAADNHRDHNATAGQKGFGVAHSSIENNGNNGNNENHRSQSEMNNVVSTNATDTSSLLKSYKTKQGGVTQLVKLQNF